MLVKKFKFKKTELGISKLYFEYSIPVANGNFDEFSLTCADLPNPSFQEALDALIVPLLQICELPCDVGDKALDSVKQECLRYINGDRAQKSLFEFAA